MQALRFEHSSILNAPVGKVWDFHVSPGALERLSPKGMGFRVMDPGQGVANGSLLKAEVGYGPFKRPWHALHSGVEENRGFTDQAIRSPFQFWVHRHSLEPVDAETTRLRDTIWLVPPRWIPTRLSAPAIKAGLRVLFMWRHRKTRREVERTSDRASSTRDERFCRMRCVKILRLYCLRKAQAYPSVRRAFSQAIETKRFAQIAGENRSS